MEKIINLADLFFSKNVPAIVLIETIIYMLPSIFFMTIPLAGLLATLIAFSRLSTDSELISMKAIGASNKALIKPLIYIGIVAALINLSMGLYFVEKGSTLAYNNLNKIVEHISIKDIKAKEMYRQIPGIILYVDKKISDKDFEDMVLIQTNNKSIINSKKATITPTDSRSIEMIFNNGTYSMENEKNEIIQRRIYPNDSPYNVKDIPCITNITYPYVIKKTESMLQKRQYNNINIKIDRFFNFIINKEKQNPENFSKNQEIEFFKLLEKLEFNYTEELLNIFSEENITKLKIIIYALKEIFLRNRSNLLMKITRDELIHLYENCKKKRSRIQRNRKRNK